VGDVWRHATRGAELPPNTLMAVNMEYVTQDHPVKDGDEVAFFPPVSGG
jgi:molybdopterin synthase sulfur carrier subunit